MDEGFATHLHRGLRALCVVESSEHGRGLALRLLGARKGERRGSAASSLVREEENVGLSYL